MNISQTRDVETVNKARSKYFGQSQINTLRKSYLQETQSNWGEALTVAVTFIDYLI